MINEVRNAVLSILNKNNYGYLSPSDFNLFAKNAQMEIFEEYFSEYNKIINMENARMAGTDYADQEQALADTIEYFLRTDALVQVSPNTNRFHYPSLTTTGYEAYMVNNATCFDAQGKPLNDAEKVSNGKINLLLRSNITKPTRQFPAYVLEGTQVFVYPSELNYPGAIKMTYFRFPKVPKWTYRTLANGEPVFDQSQSDYQDFELPKEEEYKLVAKILAYAGVSIREIEVTQFGLAEEMKQEQK